MRDDETIRALIDRIVADANIPSAAGREDLRRELWTHFEEAGDSPAAIADAMRRFGDEALVSASLRRVYRADESRPRRRPMMLVAHLAEDIRFGLRMLRRNAWVSGLAILCLTCAIGANTAVFSWIEGILLRPYPRVADQDRLAVLAGTLQGTSESTDLSWPDLADLERSATLVDAFIAEKIVGTTLSAGGDRADRVPGSVVSANYFDALGVRPVLGRGFEPIEQVGRNAHPVVVISYRFWKDRLGGDAGVIGRTQILNGVPHVIVGVTPEGFYGTFVGYAFQFWVPASMQETFDPGGYKLEDRGARWIEGFARLKPGVTREQAQQELSAIAARLAAEHPDTNRGRGLALLPVWKSPFNPMETLAPTLSIALVVVAGVLLIACANVGNLLLLKSFARRREMTARLALGAGRGRLVRQLLTEGLILSAIATAGGLGVAYWCRNALVLLFPPRGGMIMRLPATLDWRVLSLTAGVCLVSTLLFGLAPAFFTSRVNLVDVLKSESGGVVGGRGKGWVRAALVLVQVSLSFVLLAGAGLVIQSQQRMRAANPGFSAERVLLTSVDLVAAGYDARRIKIFEDELVDRIQRIDGVESAAFVRVAPFSLRSYSSAPVNVDGYDAPPDALPTVDYDEVGPGYFATMGIPLVSGREFTRADDESAGGVAVVNETMAAQYWRGADPIGARLAVKGRSFRVVGVAKTSTYRSLSEPPTPFFYVPLRQSGSGFGLVIRTARRPAAMGTAVAREVRALDAGLAPSELITMREEIDRTGSSQQVAVRLLLFFGALALVLAAVGLYGVMSAAVSQSARELALRRALGAGTPDLWRLVLWRGLTLTAAGLAAGGAAALGVTRLLGYLLYSVSPRDPAAFGAAFVVITAASLAACAIPAWRATRIDPLRALRE